MADNTDMSQREKVKAISKAMRESKITKPGQYIYMYNHMCMQYLYMPCIIVCDDMQYTFLYVYVYVYKLYTRHLLF